MELIFCMERETIGVNDDFMQFHLFQSPGHHYILTYSELVFTNKVKFVEDSLKEYGLL